MGCGFSKEQNPTSHDRTLNNKKHTQRGKSKDKTQNNAKFYRDATNSSPQRPETLPQGPSNNQSIQEQDEQNTINAPGKGKRLKRASLSSPNDNESLKMTGQYEELKRINERITADLKTKTGNLETLEHDIRQKMFHYGKERESFQEEIKKLQRNLEKTNEEYANFVKETEKKIKGNETKADDLRNENTKLVEQNRETLKAKNGEIDAFRNKLKEYECETEKLNSELAKQQAVSGPDVKSLVRSLSTDKPPASLIPRKISKRNTVGATAGKDDVIDGGNPLQLKEVVASLRSQLVASTDETKKLRNEYAALERTKRNDVLQKENAELVDNIKALEVKLEEETKRSKDYEEELNKGRNRIVELSERNAQLQQERPVSKVEHVENLSAEKRYEMQCLEKIGEIKRAGKSYRHQVELFTGTRKDKEYLHLEEMLIRNLVLLDNVESEGNAVIRKERKIALQEIQTYLEDLKQKTVV